LYLQSKTIYCNHQCCMFWSIRPSSRTTVAWTETCSIVKYNKLLSFTVNTSQLWGQRQYYLDQSPPFLFMAYFLTPPSISFLGFCLHFLRVQSLRQLQDLGLFNTLEGVQ